MIVGAKFSPAFSSPSSSSWPQKPEAAANQAISLWGLKQKGWMGFDKIPWVAKVKEEYPEAISLAQTCSIHRPEFRESAASLLEAAPASDRPLLRDYFAGKLGLEELSCRRSGAGAGMCDKRSAFQEIYQMAHQACRADLSAPPSSNLPCLDGWVG
jgi:hypothetical protein